MRLDPNGGVLPLDKDAFLWYNPPLEGFVALTACLAIFCERREVAILSAAMPSFIFTLFNFMTVNMFLQNNIIFFFKSR